MKKRSQGKISRIMLIIIWVVAGLIILFGSRRLEREPLGHRLENQVILRADEGPYTLNRDDAIQLMEEEQLLMTKRKRSMEAWVNPPEVVQISNGSQNEPLDPAIKASKRVNVLALGIEEDPRSDTIILMSFEPETKQLDLVSIPRDTYYRVSGYNRLDHRKINAAYVRNREQGTMNAVADLLGIPIHHYVAVRYEGVEAIVDILGGVEVEVPSWLDYIPTGKQVLNGEEALIFVRGRHGYRDGDLGRVKAQQQFIKSALEKAMGPKLPAVIRASFKYMETDMGLMDILYYGMKAIGMDLDTITMQTLPGKAGLYESNGGRAYYYYHDAGKTKEIVEEMYQIEDD